MQALTPKIKDKFDNQGTACTGFDYLRLGLSLYILVWHSVWNSTGSVELDHGMWSSNLRFIPAAVLPMFFALSGFLVTGSLLRTKLHQFIVLRALRLLPALAVEISLCAVVIGLVFTELPRGQYLSDKKFYEYFLNILGIIHFELPGVFTHNVGSSTVNSQLWTIPFELQCYLMLIGASLFSIIRRRFLFLMAFVVVSGAMFVSEIVRHEVNIYSHVPGRMLVLSFAAGVCLYLYRDVIPHSKKLAFLSLLLTGVALQFPLTCYLAAIPAAYLTVWIGLLRLPRISFGDISYGIFLFHYPVEQTLMHVFPEIHSWRLLSLMTMPLVFVIASASWRWIEKPILTSKYKVLDWLDTKIDQIEFLRLKTIRR